MNPGASLETLAAEIFRCLISQNSAETVEHNVQLQGPDGPRQIDIVIRGKVGPIDITTIVECKDYSRMVTVAEVDALHSVMRDVNANKAVLVARKGFSNTAKKKAKRLGITLCTAQEARSEKWPFQLQIPFVIEELSCEDVHASFEFVAIENLSPSIIDHTEFNDIPFTQLVADYWNPHEIICGEGVTQHRFIPKLVEPVTLKLKDDRRLAITGLSFELYIKKTYYFGYLNELESTRCLEFLDPPKRHVLFKPEEFTNYRSKFPRFNNKQDVPSNPAMVRIGVKVLYDAKAKIMPAPS